jgi:hypothetical protein
MIEVWKPVIGYEDFYAVSSFGNVRSIRKKNGANLKLTTNVQGYKLASLSMNGKVKHHKVHRLVAAAFIGPSNGKNVNHLNEDKGDNRPENLEYVFMRENRNYSASNKYLKGAWPQKDGRKRKWQSIITINKKRVFLGYFMTELEAHERYLLAVKETGEDKYASEQN